MQRGQAAATGAFGEGSTLVVRRDGPTLTLRLGTSVTARHLVVRQRDTLREVRVPVELVDGTACVVLDLDDLHRWSGSFERFLDLFVAVDGPGGTAQEHRLGGFAHTDRHEAFGVHRVETGTSNDAPTTTPTQHENVLSGPGADVGLSFVASRAGNFSIFVGPPRDVDIRTETTRMHTRGGALRVRGTFTTGNARLLDVAVLAVERETGRAVEIATEEDLDIETTRASNGLPHHRVAAAVPFERLAPHGECAADTVDLYYLFRFADGTPEQRRGIVVPSLLRRRGLRDGRSIGSTHVVTFTPYRTSKAQRVALRAARFTRADHRYLRRMMLVAPLLQLVRPFLGIWLLGEQPYKAQDNAYRLFQWLREHHPRRRAYYVIESDSPDRAKLEPLGNVVTMHSRDHIRYTLLASRFLGTHHTDFLLAHRGRRMLRWTRGTRIFLQHGVLGTKQLSQMYGRRAPGFSTDYFVVSSDLEAEIVRNDFGFSRRQVAVTGLARFDRLLDGTVEADRAVLIIPTWRDWLIHDDRYLQSEYRRRWNELVDDPRVRGLAESGVEVRLILHPNMRRHTAEYARPWITLLSPGDTDVQDLLKSSAALVTDYSSVGFDFSFLDRPVFYYQFDRAAYLRGHPSHLDLDAQLPGVVGFDLDEVLDALVASAATGFGTTDDLRARSAAFLAHRDGQACRRIHDLAARRGGPRVLARRVRDSDWAGRVFTTFRESRSYLPVMKVLFRVARLLPREDRVVFESGVARQYGDSPRYLYEHLLAAGSPLKVTWVINTPVRIPGTSVEKARRFSPRYFWRLGRARYWVNNQNFTHYLEPARGTRYLQTWHGTPLKKMQHDIEDIRGRDPGYLERVTTMTGFWDALVSPSPYASTAFRSAFGYDGEILELGYPRNDVLHRPDRDARAALVRRGLGLPAGRKVVLYAPTFRDDAKRGGTFVADLRLDLEQMQRRLGEEYVLLLRFHTIVKGRPRIPEELAAFVLDVTSYADTQELLLVTDVLMTDYSSIMFDFAALDRPVVLFTYDLDHYRDALRGFYLDLEEIAPGPLVRTSEEVCEVLADHEALVHEHVQRRAAFRERFAPLDDGQAAARVAQAFFGPDAAR